MKRIPLLSFRHSSFAEIEDTKGLQTKMPKDMYSDSFGKLQTCCQNRAPLSSENRVV